MTARELLEALQGLDKTDLDLPVWIQYKEQSGRVSVDKNIVIDPEPSIWNTGEMSITILGVKAIWKVAEHETAGHGIKYAN